MLFLYTAAGWVVFFAVIFGVTCLLKNRVRAANNWLTIAAMGVFGMVGLRLVNYLASLV